MARFLARWSKRRQAKLDADREAYNAPTETLEDQFERLLPGNPTIRVSARVIALSPRQRRDQAGFGQLLRQVIVASVGDTGRGMPALDEGFPTWLALTDDHVFEVSTTVDPSSGYQYKVAQQYEPSVIGPVTTERSEHFIGFGETKMFVPYFDLASARRMSALASAMSGESEG